MKIFQVTPYYFPHLGGMENVIKELSERLAKKGHQVEIFTSDIGCPKDKQLKSTKNLKIHYLRGWEIANTTIIPKLFFKLIRTKGAIIHIQAFDAFLSPIVYLLSKVTNSPIIWHIHGETVRKGKLGFLLEPYKKIILGNIIKKATRVIILNDEYKKFVSKKYNVPSKKIIILPNGVGKEFFTKTKSKNKIPHLLFVGRISIEKNLPRLIESITLCKSKFILDIVGDGELLEEINKLVKERGLTNVVFHGRKTGKELINLYQNADIFISTSDGEGFPLSILEAMASKLPIIASDVRGNHDTVKDIGILVNPPTPENFAKEIDKIFSNKKIYNRISKQSLKFAKKHTWDKVINQLEKVYKEVLREHNKKLKKKK